MHRVIQFPASDSAFVARAAQARKRGSPSIVEMKASVASNVPPLIESVKLEIVAKWRRGVSFSWLAKMHQLTVRQVEAIVWCAYHVGGGPGGASFRPRTVYEQVMVDRADSGSAGLRRVA